jgi:AtzE family amidohydrolase
VSGSADILRADAGALEVASAVREGRVTALQVTEAALARIAERDPQYNSFTCVTASRARADAQAVDAKRQAGQQAGPLAGVPYAAKNLFDIEGVVTVAGSKINRERPPAHADASLVRRMREAGAVLVGALNMDEYAYGFTTENTHYGPARNPHDTARTAGGSSGGSAAAVAGGLVPLTLGSDTNGSIRVPSSLCGIFGLKPTYGRLSRHGAYPFVASLDHVGPFARSVADLAQCYDALQGADANDPACASRAVEASMDALQAGGEKLRVAVADDYFERYASSEALEAVARVALALKATRRLTLPEAARARAAAFLISASEGGNLHLPDLRTRANDFEPLSRDRFLAGTLIPATWYVQAQRLRAWYRQQVLALFAEVDVIIAPATPCSATLIGQEFMTLAGEKMLVRPNLGMYTQPISLIGLPVLAVPVARAQEAPAMPAMPIGVQIICAPWCELDCLRIGRMLEQAGVAAAPVAKPMAMA